MKKTKVLMVCPKFPASFWSFKKSMWFIDRKVTMPPLPLVTVAAMFPVKSFDVMPIIDLNAEPLDDELIRQADIVMFTAMIVQQDSLREIIARAKRWGKPVVVGGPYATSYRDEVLAMNPAPDHLVLGEAELTLAPFIQDWQGGHAERVYDAHSVGGRNPIALTREGMPVITGTPIPRWDLLKLGKYSSLAIQFSRGCPFDCDFCDIVVLYGHQPRTKTPGQMMAELEAIYRTGWRGSLFFVDDNFIGNQKEVRKLLPVLIEWQKQHHYPFSFFTEASLNLANPDLADIRTLMIKAGFDEIFAGVESIDQKTLVEMKKRQNLGDPLEKIEILQRAGFEVTAGLIIGSDTDRPETADELFRFLQQSGIVMTMAGLLTALRGTPLYHRLKSEGRLRAESSGNNTHQFRFNFEPKRDERFLIEGYVGLLERLFSSRNYYARCRVLQSRRGSYRRPDRLNRSGILAAMRILYRNLVRRPDWEFAKFFFGSLFAAPIELPEVITYAVKFAHFEAMTEAAVKAHRYPERVATLAERFAAGAALLRGDTNRRLRRLAKLERQVLAEAIRLYDSLDRDFRASAKQALANCCERLTACAEFYRQTWQSVC